MRIGVLGDIHGGLHALRKALNWFSSEDVEAILCVGDFASLSSDPLSDLDVVRRTLEMLNELGVKVVYVWGNRDLELLERIVELEDAVYRNEALRIIHSILQLENIIEAPRDTRVRLANDLYVTRNPSLLDDITIYLTHYDHQVRKCYLHVEGHVHYAQIARNYLNAGFIHRDSLHAGLEGDGLAIVVEAKRRPKILVKPLGPVKPLICPTHYAEGIFFVPSHWRKCPVCHDWSKAKLSRTTLHI